MPQDRRPAYADLLGSLLSLRPDAATERFDALLAELLAAGHLDPADARELRWWQRESVRAVGDFLAETAPDLLAGLESSQRQADESVSAAALAWELATEPTAATEDADLLPDPTGPGARARARARARHAGEELDLRGGIAPGEGEDPDGPYDPVVPRPAPEPTADRPAGARLRKAAGRGRGGEGNAPHAGGSGTPEVTAGEPPTVVDLRTRTRPPRPDDPAEPPSAHATDTAAPPRTAAPPPVASPRRRLLLPTHPLTTRTDTW